MNTYVSSALKEKPLIKFAENFKRIQLDGILDQYAEAARGVAAAYGAKVCDVYAEWKKMMAAGVDVTELLANKLNHPIRRMHYMTAMMLLECILSD